MTGVQKAVAEYVSENGTTKDELAAKLGFKRTSFFNKLRGANEFTFNEAYRLSRELGIKLDEFYFLTVSEDQ